MCGRNSTNEHFFAHPLDCAGERAYNDLAAGRCEHGNWKGKYDMRFNGKMKAITLSYDDGVTQDRRLVEMLNRYGLKATFNLNCDILRKVNFSKE